MYRDAVIRLTAWYVAALLAACVLFSIPIYSIASRQLARGAARQGQIIERLPAGPGRPSAVASLLEEAREQQLKTDREQLIKNLVILNVLIIGAGAVLSYLFAKQTLRPLQEAHEAQAEFTANASHELRTPLATMQTEIELALRDKKLDIKNAKGVLSSNLEEVKRLSELSNQLLSLTRLDANGLQLKTVKLHEVIAGELKRLEKQYDLVGINQNLAKTSAQADEQLILQVVRILVDNAIRYAGNKPADISVSLAEYEDNIMLSVSDKGIGIDTRDLPHVFDRFYRGRNASASGHGLGLALAQEIVEQHGGTIDVTSSAKNGTSFSIQLPK